MAEHTSKKASKEQDPDEDWTDLPEGEDLPSRELTGNIIESAMREMLGNTSLPALLFVNTDNMVVRVDVDQIADPRMLEMLRAAMNLTAQVQFKRQRFQDVPRA